MATRKGSSAKKAHAKRTATDSAKKTPSGEKLVEVTLAKGYGVNRKYVEPGQKAMIPESLVATHAVLSDRQKHSLAQKAEQASQAEMKRVAEIEAENRPVVADQGEGEE